MSCIKSIDNQPEPVEYEVSSDFALVDQKKLGRCAECKQFLQTKRFNDTIFTAEYGFPQCPFE